MKVLALVCQKGGTAKTTTAINLAVEALAYGVETVIIDLDPQVSACDWKYIRGDDRPPVVVATPVPHLARALKAAADNGADLVLVDTAGRTNDAAIAAARAADLVLIPLQPSLIDLKTLASTLEIIRLGGNRPARALLGACKGRQHPARGHDRVAPGTGGGGLPGHAGRARDLPGRLRPGPRGRGSRTGRQGSVGNPPSVRVHK
jgi:MinD-like ATPase involved in chromosome partitioning or flagellar assembly